MSNNALSPIGAGDGPTGLLPFQSCRATRIVQNEHHAEFEAEFENLALAYLRLAEQAKQKDYLDIDSETQLLKQDGGPQPRQVLARARLFEMSQRCFPIPRAGR
jgi:hypothetical protein